MRHKARHSFSLYALLIFFYTSNIPAEQRWPQFRGPDGNAHSKEMDLPVKWSSRDVSWRAGLKGEGHSSPCLWDNNIFLTSAIKKSDSSVERMVICLDSGSGKIRWQKSVSTGSPEKVHGMNGFASPTCATDGEHVVAFFGLGGLYCLDMAGETIWSKNMGEFPGIWGTAASPIILDNMVIQNCDAAGKSYVIALDKKTGKTIWKTDRKNMPRGGWSTPFLIDTGARKELILNGEHGVNSYDPETGKELWFCGNFIGRGTPMPAFNNKLMMVVCGKTGDTYAVRTGGEGDITKTHMAWHTPRKTGRVVASPIVVNNYLIAVSLSGDCWCYDTETGKELWKERFKAKFSASPIAADGLAYLLDEKGRTLILKPGSKPDIVEENDIQPEKDEIFRASITPGRNCLFIRSNRTIYCIGKRE